MSKKEIEFNPEKNDKVISLIKGEDGNWTGYAKKFGKLVVIRDIGPQTVIEKIITHSGE